VLGPPQPVCHQLTHTGVPLEQAVSRQRLRPGSGFLAVKIITDGPTSVLHISDIKEKVHCVTMCMLLCECYGFMFIL
jgi:vacuolar protein sorting-associated protein 13D